MYIPMIMSHYITYNKVSRRALIFASERKIKKGIHAPLARRPAVIFLCFLYIPYYLLDPFSLNCNYVVDVRLRRGSTG